MRRDSQLKSRGENDNHDTALDGSTQSLNSSATEATSHLFERGTYINTLEVSSGRNILPPRNWRPPAKYAVRPLYL
jgi:hypothetical protein